MDNRDDNKPADWANLANAMETSRGHFQQFLERLAQEQSKAARWSMWAAIASALAAGILAAATVYQIWQGGPAP